MFELLIIVGGIVAAVGAVLGWEATLVRIGIALLLITYGLLSFPYPREDRHKLGLAVGCVLFALSGSLALILQSWWPLPAGVVAGYGVAYVIPSDKLGGE